MAAQQPAKKLSIQSTETTGCSVLNPRRISNAEKGSNRVPISIPRTSIGVEIEDDMKKLAKGLNKMKSNENQSKGSSIRKIKSRDGSTKYWAWLEDMEPDALDGLTEEKKEKLKLAAAARRLIEELEDEEPPEQPPEEVKQYLSRVTSEILISDKSVTTLGDRATSEPSVIVHDESILDKVKLWHPSGPAKVLKTIMKKDSGRGFINVCFEPGAKNNLSFVPRFKQHSVNPVRKTKSEKIPLIPKISIVNMCFRQFLESLYTKWGIN